jgi:phosphoglycolate phosphatase
VSTPRLLVLWDIDLTLLDLRRLGARWFREALVEVTGRTAGTVPPFGGRTDRWIAAQLLRAVDLDPTDELIDRLHRSVERRAAASRAELARLGVVLPGVPDVLRALAGRPEVAQSLVTGNLRAVAGVKVGAFGLDKYLDLDIGGYGSTSELRAELVAQALAGARHKHGTEFPAESVVVIGDTPHDVAAALAHGVRAIAVATGSFPAEDLWQAGAHHVLSSLGDTELAIGTILSTGTGY